MCEWRTIARSPAVSEPPAPLPATGAAPVSGPADGGGDRRREAVVEGLRQPEALVDVVPAGLQRPSVDAQLARVVEAEQLDPAEVRLAERPELLGAVLLDVP